jgi:serine/threonine protein phosphatase PrpC
MKVEAYGISDIGMKRVKNEDSFLINKDAGLFVVADGMGGHAGGEFASRLAVETIGARLKDVGTPPRDVRSAPDYYIEQITSAIKEAGKRIYEEAERNPMLKGMGTTAVLMFARDERIYIAHVGDSRAYLVRDGRIVRLTKDHSLVGEQIRAGLLPESAEKNHKFRNIITRSVGFQEDVEIDIRVDLPVEGDRYLLCTDGLTTLVDDDEILDVVAENSVEEAVQLLIDLANMRGGDDNITVVLAEVKDVKGDVTLDPSEESTIGM